MEGTAGRLAYLNRIDECRDLAYHISLVARDEGVELERLPMPRGGRGHRAGSLQCCKCDAVAGSPLPNDGYHSH